MWLCIPVQQQQDDNFGRSGDENLRMGPPLPLTEFHLPVAYGYGRRAGVRVCFAMCIFIIIIMTSCAVFLKTKLSNKTNRLSNLIIVNNAQVVGGWTKVLGS